MTQLLTTSDVARRLGVAPAWVRYLARAGELRCLRLSDGPRARMRFREEDLREYEEKRRRKWAAS